MNDPIYYVDELGERALPVEDVWPKGAQYWVYHPEEPVTPYLVELHTPPKRECPAAGMYRLPVGDRLWLPMYPEPVMPSVCKGLPLYPEPTTNFEQALREWVAAHFEVPAGWQFHRAWVATQSGYWCGLCCVIVPLGGNV